MITLKYKDKFDWTVKNGMFRFYFGEDVAIDQYWKFEGNDLNLSGEEDFAYTDVFTKTSNGANDVENELMEQMKKDYAKPSQDKMPPTIANDPIALVGIWDKGDMDDWRTITFISFKEAGKV